MWRSLSLSARRFSSSSPSHKRRTMNLWTLYNQSLEERPIMTKCITSGVLSFAADIVCQKLFPNEPNKPGKQKEKLDWIRVAKFTAIGTFFVGPILHYWYGFLARTITGTGVVATVKRVACDQLIFAPCFLPAFFSVLLTLDGRMREIPETLRRDLWSTLMTNYTVWVPAMVINFRFVPPLQQVLFSNVVGFFWNIYLSFQSFKNHKLHHQHVEDDAESEVDAAGDSKLPTKSER